MKGDNRMKEHKDVSVKNALNELLETSIFKKIAERNNKKFAEKLAMWLIRYILIISSMSESLKINLETVLLKLHGENFGKIMDVTNKSLGTLQKDSDKYDRYIW
jgi:diketogulonate reductase-like aldo/keto reductase